MTGELERHPSAESSGPGNETSRAARLAWLPLPLLLGVMIALWAMDLGGGSTPRYLAPVLNLVFSAAMSVFAADLAARSFLDRGSPGLLLLGCGALFWGGAGLLGGAFIPHGFGLAVAIRENLAWLSAACQLTGAILLLRPTLAVGRTGLWLAAGYALVLLTVALIAASAVDESPTLLFFGGEENTLARQSARGSAIVMFALAALLLLASSRGRRSFSYWYGLALALIACGLAVRTMHGGVLAWPGRVAIFLGGVYMLVGMRTALRESRPETRRLESALKESEDRYRSLMNAMPDAVIVHRDNRFLYANPVALRLFGAESFEELSERTVLEFMHPDCREEIKSRIDHALDGGRTPLKEHRLQRLDGQETPFEASGISVLYEGRKAVLAVLRDISERKRREEELERLNRTLRAIYNSNLALVRAKDEKEFLEAVCRIIVEDCGHAMVWIGYARNDEAKTVSPMAQAGFDEGYIENLDITWSDTERGRGPTGSAIRACQTVMCRDMLTDPQFAPWREEALKRGYRSSIVLPLMDERRAFGAVCIYSRRADSFTEDESRLLAELTADLSAGVHVLRARAAQKKFFGEGFSWFHSAPGQRGPKES